MNQKEKQKNQRLYKTYGVTLEEFNKILESQDGVCGACGLVYPRMCLDHIHQKGFKTMPPEQKKKYVRGIVCFLCNTSFKNFDKTVNGKVNRQRLNGVYKYFQKHKLKGEI